MPSLSTRLDSHLKRGEGLHVVCTRCRHVSMAAILFFAFMLFSIPSIRSDLCMGGASREVVIRFPVPWALHIVIRVGFWSSKNWPLLMILVLIDLH